MIHVYKKNNQYYNVTYDINEEKPFGKNIKNKKKFTHMLIVHKLYINMNNNKHV